MTSSPVTPARILVVEDEPPNRDLLARLLVRHGYTVDVACDGSAAIAAMAAVRPDVILLDVGLPGVDGFEVCRAIKANSATRLTPVVLVTGFSDRAHKIRGIEAGADDFLTKPYDEQELTARVGSLVRLKRYTDELESAESVILSLALTVEARDTYTVGHCQRLAAYSTGLGVALGLPAEQIAALQRGGYLHDVGKIGIPDAILLKPGPLTADEYETMKTHTTIGERLCGELRSLSSVRPIVRHHHERLDGSGYPDGLRGDEIPVLAQIVAIADAYDAMTISRVYRAARSPQQARDELTKDMERGRHRPDLIHAFIDVQASK